MRKRKPKLRVIQPDPRYGDPVVTRFVNNLMWQGKKSTAYQIFYDAMDLLSEKSGANPHELFGKALENTTPSVEVKSRRIGGATFQIPTEINPKRKVAIGMKWLIRFARERNGKGMAEKLSAEVLAASKGEGNAVKRKEDTHKMAEANRAFAHFK
ncbi:MAG: 30S ribosomal protein S7 [Saprospiraceae bacterium]|jgi:small subunit ribosomal protein S7|nr:30S ribosomal protein S7 [Candidatus Opimibacter skivensis]MBL0006295.1 30S ribosomal protein S7 [Candidatus Opimibacter skivensis]HQW01845.1 30S ribosomal protein S7 [Saprospiraceae bacterium]HQW24352.1 30S ribosomal protein S7 [Saprospiraceae bacterium]